MNYRSDEAAARNRTKSPVELIRIVAIISKIITKSYGLSMSGSNV